MVSNPAVDRQQLRCGVRGAALGVAVKGVRARGWSWALMWRGPWLGAQQCRARTSDPLQALGGLYLIVTIIARQPFPAHA